MKKGIGLIIAIVLIVVGSLGYFGYRYMTPKRVLVRTLNSYKDGIYENNKHSDNINKILSKDYKALDVDGKMSVDGQNIDFDIKYNEDSKDKISQLKFDLGIDKTKLSGDIVSTNKKLYLMIKDVFKKYYYTDLGDIFGDDYINFLKNNEQLDTEVLFDLFIDSIDENISNNNFIGSKETITLDGKKIKTSKYTLTCDNNLNNKIITTFIKKVKNNNDASTTLSKLLNMEDKDLDKTLNSYLEKIKDEEKPTYTLNVYTKLNKTYLIEVEIDGDSIAINKDKDTYNFIIKSEDTTITGKLLTHNKDKIKLEAKMKNKYYTMDIENVTDITKSSNKEIDMNSVTTISMMEQSVKLDMKMALKEGTVISSDIIKNADNMDNISEKEAEAFSKIFMGDSFMNAQFKKNLG